MNMALTTETFWGGQVEPALVDPDAPIWTAEFLSSALAGVGVGSWQLDLRTGLVTWDAVTSGVFGLEEISVTTASVLPVHEEDQAALWESLKRCGDTGEPHDMVFRGLHSDGSIRWLHARGTPFPAHGCNPRYIAGFVHDVTSRKLADVASEESERRLRSLFASLPGIAYCYEGSAPWRMRFVSDAVEKLTGHPAADFLSNTVVWESLIVPEDRQAVRDEVARAVAEQSRFHIRYRLRCLSGDVRWVEERGAAVYSDDGLPQFVEGFVGDIHEQVTAEQKLRHSEERFRVAAQATQDVIWDWDPVRNETTRTSEGAENLGFSSKELSAGREGWLSRVHPEDRDRVSEQSARVFNGTTDRFVAEYRLRKEDGSYAEVLDRGYLIRGETGQPLRMVGAMLDNTERNAFTRALYEREAQLSTIFGQALVGILHRSITGELLMANERFCEIFGRTEDELRIVEVAEYTHIEDRSWDHPAAQYARAKRGERVQTEKRYVRPDGSVVWCEVSMSFVQAADGQEGSFIIVAHDVSARKSAEQALKDSELLYRSVLEASADRIDIVDLEGRLELMNPPGIAALEIEDFGTVRFAVWEELWPAEARPVLQTALLDARAGKAARFTALCPTALGTPKWWDVMVSPMLNEEGRATKILAISRDITAQRAVAAEVQWASEHDALTGLANRRAFEAHLKAATIRAMQGSATVGLLLLDVDRFKHVNDTLGHAAGDHLLAVFGQRLKQCVRTTDFVARLGGDEFAVILEGRERDLDLPTAGESILRRLMEPVKYSGRTMSAGASIGGALFPRDAITANELFNNADTALYALKESGRGGTMMFHQHMREEAQLLSSQLSLARSSITPESVEPHYQQKIDLSTGRIAGFEALLRWRHVSRGIQQPDTVAEAFKDYELASKIGDLMQRHVFSDMRGWLDKGLPFGIIAINAAPVEFLRDDFAERVLARMQEYAIPPHLVEIEVTEHVFIARGSDLVGRALRVLSRAGVRIALDDFGTGYSSLSHLRDYPVDVVKIDRSFTDKITADPEVCAIVCAVLDLARSLNLEVVAEGVETYAQKRLLVEEGCGLAQGFLFGGAVGAAEVPQLLQSSSRSMLAA